MFSKKTSTLESTEPVKKRFGCLPVKGKSIWLKLVNRETQFMVKVRVSSHTTTNQIFSPGCWSTRLNNSVNEVAEVVVVVVVEIHSRRTVWTRMSNLKTLFFRPLFKQKYMDVKYFLNFIYSLKNRSSSQATLKFPHVKCQRSALHHTL